MLKAPMVECNNCGKGGLLTDGGEGPTGEKILILPPRWSEVKATYAGDVHFCRAECESVWIERRIASGMGIRPPGQALIIVKEHPPVEVEEESRIETSPPQAPDTAGSITEAVLHEEEEPEEEEEEPAEEPAPEEPPREPVYDQNGYDRVTKLCICGAGPFRQRRGHVGHLRSGEHRAWVRANSNG